MTQLSQHTVSELDTLLLQLDPNHDGYLSPRFPDSSQSDQGATIGSFATVKDCIDSFGSNPGTIVLRHNSGSAWTDYVFSTDETIPSHITVLVECGARIDPDFGVTVTFEKGPRAGPHQIFTGNGDVVGTGPVFVEWFDNDAGDGTTNCGAGFQKAVDYSDPGRVILLPGGDYLVHQNVILGNTHIQGNGATIRTHHIDGFTITTSSEPINGVFTTKVEDGNYSSPTTITKLVIEDVNFVAEYGNLNEDGSQTGTARNFVIRLAEIDGARIRDCTFNNSEHASETSTSLNAYVDMHHAVRDVVIDGCYADNSADSTWGGCFWTRGYNEGNGVCQQIYITNCTIRSNCRDELVDFFSKDGATTRDAFVSNCLLHAYGDTHNIISARAEESGSTVRNVIVSNCVLKAEHAVSRIAKTQDVGTLKGIQISNSIIFSTIDTDGSFIAVDGFETVENVQVFVEGYLNGDTDNHFIFFECGHVSNCDVIIGSAVQSGILTDGSRISAAYSCTTVDNSRLDGRIYDVDKVRNCEISLSSSPDNSMIAEVRELRGCTITAPNMSSYRLFQNTNSESFHTLRIIDNTFIDSSASNSTEVIYLDNIHDAVIRGNTYHGIRDVWGDIATGVRGKIREFENNVMFTGADVERHHSDRCVSTSDPWTLYGGGVELMPVGKIVRVTDPTSASSQGWVKEVEPGTTSGDWLSLPNLP